VDLARANSHIQTTLGVTELEFGALIERYLGRE
jgi:hypothetical protein